MIFSLLTLFPEMFEGPVNHSIVQRAQEKNLVTINLINIRDFATDQHKTVDDKPYGGGTGMIMKVDIVHKAIQYALESVEKNKTSPIQNTKIVLLDPKGPQYTQEKASGYAKLDHLILICGHYEGIDSRIEKYIDETCSIGPYVLTGGEIPAMAILDSVTRLIPGVLPPDATVNESFSQQDGKFTLEHPQYTRPETYEGHTVPKVLKGGNHAKIMKWKKNMSKAYKPK